MKKVCLVKGGNFVLGIEDCYILSRQNGTLAPETVKKKINIFHLSSLLSCKHCDRPEPGSVFLQIKKGKSSFFLLVDQVIDEIELPAETTRLPPPSPEFAQQLFPKVAVCMNLIVLLLDPGQIIPVAKKLGPKIGLLSPKYCVQVQVHKEANKQANKQVLSVAPAATITENGKKAKPVAVRKKIKKDKKRPKSVDEETFKGVMAWTIAQFKQGKVSEEQLSAKRLPPGVVQQEELSDTVIQYLIDQISLRCQESITPHRPGEHHGR
ncbi:MAG: hypothetical protein D3913_06395 [Candidatus Electrothrix sp. LOE1_4_5]|nr:hypothetical protein [Candidatus Electrothrix gigas]